MNGAGSSWRKRLSGMVSGGRTMRSLLTAARMKRVDTSKVVLDDTSAAIWQQGDESMYTAEAVLVKVVLVVQLLGIPTPLQCIVYPVSKLQAMVE